jgi:hypothetical protein
MTAPRAKHTVPQVAKMGRAYYAKPGKAAGGSLHLVLEEPNYSAADVTWCLEHARAQGDAAGVELAQVLMECSKSQRRRIARSR